MEKAKLLEQLIKDQGYNARSFAAKCGIPYTTLYGILKNGVGRASVDNVILICRNLGLSIEELEGMVNHLPEQKEPTYDDTKRLLARNGKNLSTEQKMELIKLLSEL